MQASGRLRAAWWVRLASALLCGCGGDTGGPAEPESGTLIVTVTTSGQDLDLDGYSLQFWDRLLYSPVIPDPVALDTVLRLVSSPGVGPVTLDHFDDNCNASGPNSQLVTIVAGEETSISFNVVCVQAGGIAVSTSTIGSDLDLNDYQLLVSGVEPLSVATNGLAVRAKLRPGLRDLELLGVARNCTVQGSHRATVAVVAGTNAPVNFQLDCARIIDRAVAFAAFESGFEDIFVRHADGRGIQNVTNHAASDQTPRWSPDRRRIVFISDRTGKFALYTMDPDGSNVVPLTDGSRDDVDPQWSPDGSKILFRGMPGDIYVVNSDGTGLVQLTSDPRPELGARWSPDGSRIAYSRGTGAAAEILVMNQDGSGQSVIATPGMWPQWAPDGSAIAYAWVTDPCNFCGSPSLRVMDPDGSHVTSPGSISGFDVSWSFDSQWLGGPAGIVRPDGTGFIPFLVSGYITGLAWAPTEPALVLSTRTNDGCISLQFTDASGSEAVALSRDVQPCPLLIGPELSWGPVE